MDAPGARSLLAELARRVGDRVIMWRGPELEGSDVDLLVVPGAERDVRVVLEAADLTPDNRHPGRTIWSARLPDEPPFDVREVRAWPAYYPSLAGVSSRAAAGSNRPPAASAEDRLLILAADAVVGRPLEPILARARPLLHTPGIRERLRLVARPEQSEALAELIGDLDRLVSLERRGRLAYRPTVRLAVRSKPARAALVTRLSGLARFGVRGAIRRRLGR